MRCSNNFGNFLLIINLLSLAGCRFGAFLKSKNPNYKIIKVISRPNNIFYTQGLFMEDVGKILYESGGLYSESVMVKMEYPSLNVLEKRSLSSNYFAEGAAKCGNFIYQLTWKERAILKYTYPDLVLVETLKMDDKMKEGWGLSSFSNDNELIASDGSSSIYFLDCLNNLSIKKTLSVKLNDTPVTLINALCYAEGYIWANKYLDRSIYKIDPSNGNVVKTYEMSGLIDYEYEHFTLTSIGLYSGLVLNGIAYNQIDKKFILTGKKWGHYYEIVFN